MSTRRYIPNEFPDLLDLPDPPETLLLDALHHIVRSEPPQPSYHSAHKVSGIASGPTALAYLFLRLSKTHPDLNIDGYSPIRWAEAYLRGNRGTWEHRHGNCGITSESVSLLALNACLSQDTALVEEFIEGLEPVLSPTSAEPFPSELLRGRAGTLYLIRVIRYFVPLASRRLDDTVATLNRQILDEGEYGRGNWLFHGKHYYGAAHGDISIITQLVLTTPSLAPRLRPRLEMLLDAQFESGNWPSSIESPADRLVQWCHGAPGFVISLLALKPYFPDLNSRIDHAVEMGRACIWERGLLRKEPSLCHGILGNAL
ncbi:hypothetical protein VUR80DRAFT_5383 [Thermomyces stellatus]